MKKLGKFAVPVIAVAVILLLILYQTGIFGKKDIAPGESAPKNEQVTGKIVKLTPTDIPVYYKTVGTVRSRDEIELSPRITARVQDITRRSGDSIKKDELLVSLDDADLKAAREQAADNLTAAKATFDRAEKDYLRQKTLLEKMVITRKTFETAEAAWKSSKAAVAAAEQAVKQSEANLDYARIVSPMNAIVAERYVDPGDMASPGNIMLKIFDPTRLMLYVPIRETLVKAVKVNDHISFDVGALKKTYTGEVREIIPSVDPGSRTFMIKMCILGDTKQLMPGMFGTVKVGLDQEKAYIIPEHAVTRIGQLEYLTVAQADGSAKRVLIRTISGPTSGTLKVISGIDKPTRIVIPE